MARHTKVLFIGLDSAEPELIRQWMEDGSLPTFRALRERGAWSSMSNLPGFGNSSTWASVATGVNPGSHRNYFNLHFRPETYRVSLFRDEDFGVAPFWGALSRAGKRVAAIDMSWAPLCPDLNGIQLVDWATHDPRHPQTLSWPPDLASEVTARFGSNPMLRWDRFDRDSARAHKRLRDLLVERVARKADLSLHYLERGGWDLFMTAFGEPHDVGHEQWHLHDTSHPLHDADWRQRHGDPVKDVYVAIDKAIARLLDGAGPETTTIVFSGPGMGPNYTGNHLFDDILRRLERGSDASAWLLRGTLSPLYRRLVSGSMRRRLGLHIRTMDDAKLAAERRSRRIFAVPNNDDSGAIRVNLVGREPNGVVRPGAEFDACCAELARDLKELVNLGTGKPLVERIVRVRDICSGEHVDDLPDLLVSWRRDGPISAIGSPKLGELAQPYEGWRTGDHTPRCLLFARGPRVAPGRLAAPPSLTDLAPTMAALLGEALPQAEGKPIVEFGLGRQAAVPA